MMAHGLGTGWLFSHGSVGPWPAALLFRIKMYFHLTINRVAEFRLER